MSKATKTKSRSKLRKNDVVVVISGKDRGRQGRTISIEPVEA